MRTSFFDSFSMVELPRQTVGPRVTILEAGSDTDRLVFLEYGAAIGSDKMKYGDGHALNFKEFLAGSLYFTSITSQSACRVIHIPRDYIREALCRENALTWTVARCVATEHLALQGAG